jgi:photosystem II stability/assembly factor-like uncharacterized protein
MKRLLTFILLSLLTVRLAAQDFRAQIGITPADNFFEICAKADAFFQTDYVSETRRAEHFGDDEYRAYQRWKWYWHTRVDENGNFPDLAAAQEEINQLFPASRNMASTTWTNISQATADGGYNGMGRTTCIAFDPNNANTYYVGAPIGGLWKTTNAGQSWTPLTDALPYVSVGSCVIDPTNTNTLYISVGDHSGWWTYSMGVYKSTDGGATWTATGLSWSLSQGRAIAELAMDPLNASVIYAATTNGLYKTTNGGTSWTVVHTGYHSDICFEPGTSNLYAATNDYWGSSEVYRTTDGGSTWNQLTSFNTNYNSLKLAVTPANAAKLAILNRSNGELLVSTNYGANLTLAGTCPEDDVLLISPNNANIIYCGAMFVNKSTDGGATWNQLTYWYYNPPYDEVHADQRNSFFHPLQPDKMFFCNDGGVYIYSESGNSWSDISDGLKITQFYKMAISPTNAQIILGGTQDNGGRMRDNTGTWRSTNGGDAMEVAIDPTNNNVIYTTYIYGKLYRSLDGWVNDTYNEISANIPGGTPPGSWVNPYMLDPSDHNTIVAGYDDVWRSTDRGDNWTALSTNITGNGSTLNCLAVAPSDPNTIYVSWGSNMRKTTDMGATWTTVTVTGTAEITSITVHPANPNVIWITRGEYTGGIKVYHSTNGGSSWANLSTGLPNVPVNTLLYQNGGNGIIYIGTDGGVFYRDSITNSWQLYSNGLPKTSITDLEIYYPTNKLRAATYGRGIWEVDLASPLSTGTAAAPSPALVVFPNPNNGVFEIRCAAAGNTAATISVTDVFGKLVYTQTAGSKPLQERIDLSGLASGTYIVSVQQNETVSRTRITIR